MRNSHLSDLEAFAAVARHRSFRRAAGEWEVSPSLLSQAIKRLEERFGVRLLNRTTRSVSPTQAGEELLAGLSPAFAGIEAALERIASLRGSPGGLLRLNAPRPAAHFLLAPLVASFLSAHQDVMLELIVEDGFVDVAAEGYDAGIRFGETLARDMIAVPLGPAQRMLVVASLGYLAQHGRPDTPAGLAGHAMIRHRFPGGVFDWEFERGGEAISVTPSGPLTVNDAEVKLRACADGAGLAFEFEGYARPYLDAGQLVTVLEDWCPSFPGPFLYYSARRHMPAALRAFIDFVHEHPRRAGSPCTPVTVQSG